MAVVIGTNAGLVTVRPTVDPDGSNRSIGNACRALKITPTENVTIKEIGWYHVTFQGENQNWECAIYSHDAINDVPNASLQKFQTNSTGTVDVWLYKDGLTINLTADTTYWIVIQCDIDSDFGPYLNYSDIAGQRVAYDTGEGTLQDPWDTTTVIADRAYAMYALYEAAPPPPTGTGQYINVGDNLKQISHIYLNKGDAWKNVPTAYINKGDVLKKLF